MSEENKKTEKPHQEQKKITEQTEIGNPPAGYCRVITQKRSDTIPIVQTFNYTDIAIKCGQTLVNPVIPAYLRKAALYKKGDIMQKVVEVRFAPNADLPAELKELAKS